MENKIPESWIEMIANQEASGESVLAWCKENGVPSSTFYYRRKKKLRHQKKQLLYLIV